MQTKLNRRHALLRTAQAAAACTLGSTLTPSHAATEVPLAFEAEKLI
jgi:hypothetical protein